MPRPNRGDADRQILTRNRLAAIVQSSADAIIGETLDGIITDWNPAAERLYGYTAEEVMGRPFMTVVPPERSGESAAILARVLQRDPVEDLETVRWTKDGRRIEVSLTVFPVVDDAGEIVATSAIVRDITARKATERALAGSEALLRVAFENAPIGMVLASPDERILRVNRALCEMLGYTADALMANGLWAFTHPEDIDANRLFMQRAMSGEIASYEMEKRYIHRDGHIIWGHLSGSLVRDDEGAPRYFVSQIQDITARKHADEALAASEERFRIAFADAPIGMALVAADEQVLQANRALCAMLGYSEAELVGVSLRFHTHPDDIPANQSLVERTQAGEADSYALEKRYLRQDGGIVWASLTASCVRDEAGAIRYYLSQIQDVTARKAAEEDLAVAAQRTRHVLESITDGFFALDQAWRIIDLNPAAERLLGRTRDGLLGNKVCEETVPVMTGPLYAALTEAMTEGRPASAEGHYPPVDRWFELRAYPAPEGLFVFFRDITERKRTDQELQAALNAAKAANQATRQFLTMMSHELRTPMQAIIGYAELLLAGPKTSLTSEQAEDVQTIRRGANRLVDLVKQMLDISRLDAGQLELKAEPVSLRSVIESVCQDVAPQAAAKTLTLCIDLPIDLPHVLGDEMGVHQVLLNLAGNAVKFTERGEVRISAEASEDEVAVVVTDTGVGISREALPHIFDEFHQGDRGMTRRYDGAGLGLTIARRLAERMGGSLSAESQPGIGSTFRLRLPAARPPFRA
jgi:two-component system sensor histidine kinase/response regulator